MIKFDQIVSYTFRALQLSPDKFLSALITIDQVKSKF